MKSTLRALRRHHRQRLIRRAFPLLRWYNENDPEKQWARTLRWYNNLAKCDCWICKNPRRVPGEYERSLTLQEQRLHQAANAELELLFAPDNDGGLSETEG